MGTIRTPYDYGSVGTEATAFIQRINTREPDIHELWCLGLDGISHEVQPTVHIEVTSGSIGEFVTNYLTEMVAKFISSGNFMSTTASGLLVCPTMPG